MHTSNQICVQTVDDEFLRSHDVSLRVIRFDLAHPVVGGNKWYKLQHNLALARVQGATRLLSFGGAYSNHIYALAAAGADAGFDTLGVIRGELVTPLNSTLAFARSQGMQLIPVSRADYRRRSEADFLLQLQQQYGPFYLIPEGGANAAGVQGCEQMAFELAQRVPDLAHCEIALACGTGTTLAGLLRGLEALCHRRELASQPFTRGFAVLKGAGFLRHDIRHWLSGEDVTPSDERWALETEYHGGGYARAGQGLLDFIASFQLRHNIPLEPVYTGKLLQALYQRIEAGHYAPGSRILALHTGGLRPVW
ncbi:1-aminocyclopropane-1-carboxylate deaminase/D-cysteine desulfhydrase [Pseudohongiella acticola]|jgi:1-aminocyclopropane-1-carboxylate deaminase/D-cysteine desulfhydrase-like pyridoxal-dependent ACC family enzyme|uniref:1-aminocyclopropane-1-carboxylate deaminase/D-cysteine desulfhydrase n=1 Tax=Pseudohongiella acticola TaxID=1524254 RepID=UPI0030EC9C1E